jgi:site-specific DNA-methyltransferase (adenine-specific)
MNTLYYGDNLDILQRYIKDESVDLVYLDPPFNSNANYNVLFKEHDGAEAASQIQAFEDTWKWDETAARNYELTVEGGGQLSETLQAFRRLVGESDMLAYLSMMAPRLNELRRVLKKSGSIYLHCDPTASHYLKLLMDAVFGPKEFINEITWQRSTSKGHAHTRFPTAQDTILFYGNGDSNTWNKQFAPYRTEYIKSHYGRTEPETGRRYQLDNCINPNPNRPNLTYEWNGLTRVWRWTKEKMTQLDRDGRIVYTRSGMPRYKRYLDEMPGTPLTSVWTDISPINSQAQERLGYPTQKPLALLERIISASSNEGDVVLDPFCGCGTTIDAAQKLNRQWIGIDITHLAINLIKHRLQDTYGEEINSTYEVIGEPTSVPDARILAAQDPYQFQWWALGLVGARPVEQKKGADKGIDGRLYFHLGDKKTHQVIFSVKAGKMTSSYVRDLRGVVERENAEIGVLISMHAPTKPMQTEALEAGFYESQWGKHRKIQLVTVGELLEGTRIDMPPVTGANVTFKRARKHRAKGQDQMSIGDE